MKVYSVFCLICALLAVASAQCSWEGKTYKTEAVTITFGTPTANEWLPAIIHAGSAQEVHAAAFKLATLSRVDVFFWGATAEDTCDSETKGHYTISWNSDCSKVTFQTISDGCEVRSMAMTSGNPFTEVSAEDDSGCLTVGHQLMGTLSETEESPRLSGDSVTFTVGMDGFVLSTIGGRVVVLERWSLSGSELTSVGVASYPDGFACDSRYKGRYSAAFGDECAVTLCGTVDSCRERAGLYHGVQLNGDEGSCSGEVVPEPEYTFEANGCSDGRQWLKHPWDCIDQGDKGSCFFCRGIANDQTVSMCLDRQGGGCNQIFESQAAVAFCNLEFECPASSTVVSLAVLLLAVLAVVFVF